MTPEHRPGGPIKERLRLPEGNESTVQVIGEGAGAAPAVVELLTRLGVIGR
jgi:electron transfer flavoprotein beta subunit